MKFDMGRAWNDAIALLRANQQVVLVVAGVFFFLPYLALIILMPGYAQTLGAGGTSEAADPNAALAELSRIYSQIWWAILIMAVVQGIGMLGLLALLTDRDRPTVAQALAIGAKCFLPYLGAQILQSIAIVIIVLIPFVVGGVAGVGVGVIVGLLAAVAAAYLFTKFSLAIPVIVMDGVMNPIAALGRSWSLTKGNSLRLFAFYLLLVIALIVIAILLSIVFGIIGALTGPDGALFVAGLSNALLNMIGIALFLAVLASIHRQLAGPSAAAVNETFG
jgi:hypothetical protein